MNLDMQTVFYSQAQPVPVAGYPGVVMGIDQSLTNTGIAVAVSGFVRTFSIGWGAEVGSIQRLAKYRQEIADLLDRYNPDVVVMEGYSFGSKFSRPHTLGELGATIKLAIYDANRKLILCPPTTLKQFVTGIGKGSKAEILKAAKARWSLKTTQNDEIDAAALAFVGVEVQHRLLQNHAHCLYPDSKGKGGVEIALTGPTG